MAFEMPDSLLSAKAKVLVIKSTSVELFLTAKKSQACF